MTSTPPVPSGPVVRVRATVAYDGSGFHGFAENAGVRTVAGELVAVLTQILRADSPIDVTCAGRTDRGVHATGQVVHFDVPPATDLVELARRVNKRVGPEVALRDLRPVPAAFDARFDAISRRYRYLVWNRPEPNPFLAGRAWHVERPLDLALLRLACDPFIGLHDFSAFCKQRIDAEGRPATLMRRVTDARWQVRSDGVLAFEIQAKAFCHQMVRSIVGTIVEVGYGRRSAGDIRHVLESLDRVGAGDVAPPHGLYLIHVGYEAGAG